MKMGRLDLELLRLIGNAHNDLILKKKKVSSKMERLNLIWLDLHDSREEAENVVCHARGSTVNWRKSCRPVEDKLQRFL